MIAIDKIREQLNWKGPNDKQMGHIVLTRAEAVALIVAWNYQMSQLDKMDKMAAAWRRQEDLADDPGSGQEDD